VHNEATLQIDKTSQSVTDNATKKRTLFKFGLLAKTAYASVRTRVKMGVSSLTYFLFFFPVFNISRGARMSATTREMYILLYGLRDTSCVI